MSAVLPEGARVLYTIPEPRLVAADAPALAPEPDRQGGGDSAEEQGRGTLSPAAVARWCCAVVRAGGGR